MKTEPIILKVAAASELTENIIAIGLANRPGKHFDLCYNSIEKCYTITDGPFIPADFLARICCGTAEDLFSYVSSNTAYINSFIK